MPNESIDARVKCPFYRGVHVNTAKISARKEIICEGLTGDCTLRLCFHKNDSIKQWLLKHCMRHDYESACPIAEMLMKKYDDTEFAKARKEAGL